MFPQATRKTGVQTQCQKRQKRVDNHNELSYLFSPIEKRTGMIEYLNVDKDFNMLSLKDLIQARDMFHLQLSHKENVVATALGRYLIRRSEPWPTDTCSAKTATEDAARARRGPRTLYNSEVRPYSWPCILVFVEKWIETEDFGYGSGKRPPGEMIPKALYTPDGRAVPLCVVEAPQKETISTEVSGLKYPDNLIGGGYPALADVQEQEHVASIGCLVSDGHTVYALTNRHVCGEAGEPIYSLLDGEKTLIGHSSAKQLRRLPFEKVYADWPGKNVYVNMDIGLINIHDKNVWTAQVYGIGKMGPLADLSIDNISLRLIGCPVRAFGCASKQMYGEIHALFYRYKSVGGFEYVADFLIGNRERRSGNGRPDETSENDDKKKRNESRSFSTHPGDSGTLWLLDTGDEQAGLMPMAVQWGGHVFADPSGSSQIPFALATCLSTVCNLLEVDVVRDWNTGIYDYWGAVGHYTIGNKAIQFVQNTKLNRLMTNNLENISYQVPDITDKNLKGLTKLDFVPLADVPDMAWKFGPANRGQPEHPNHFADMDKPLTQDLKLPHGSIFKKGSTLLDICSAATKNVAVDVWQAYYTAVQDDSRGLLPFRVWQIYEAMVTYLSQGKAAEFVCAAGILSHYVGDACQPLHISYMFNGDPNDLVEAMIKDRKTGEKKKTMIPRATGVHAAYEDDMVNYHIAEIMAGVDSGIKDLKPLARIKGGSNAAIQVVQLMQDTFKTIKPHDILVCFNKAKGKTKRQVADDLWDKFGNDTIAVITNGSRYLGMLWDSAWKEGTGDTTIKDFRAIDQDVLGGIYKPKTFLPSVTIDKISKYLA